MIKTKRRKNPKMAVALAAGAILNVIFLLILGGFTVYKFVQPEEVKFEAPTELAALEPPVVKYNQNKTKDRMDKSSRPRQQQIRTKTISQINTPDINIQIADIAPSVSVSAGVGNIGNGSGLGGGGGLRMGVSAVDFFGIKSKGERIVIIMDIARSMLEPRRGDITGFADVKQKLAEVTESLNSATLFNLMVFSNGLDVMSEQLVLANAENKQRAIEFIDPYWKANGGRFTPDYKRSVFRRNYTPKYRTAQPIAGSSRMDMALLAAFEQGADAIFMITDGTPQFTRNSTDNEQRVYDKERAEYDRKRAKATPAQVAAYEAKLKKTQAQVKARRAAAQKASNAQRAARGLDAAITENGDGLGQHVKPPWGNEPKDHVPVRADRGFVHFIKAEAEALFGRQRNQYPSVNIIGYAIPKRGPAAQFLNEMRRAFPGSQFEIFGEYREAADNA